jgi:galactose mutarotase-like enzyme
MEFSHQLLSSTELLFTLSDTKETLSLYPFKFRLGIRYKLSGHSVSCSYEVENPDHSDLLFSIGGHPAFAAPLQTGEAYTDYYLEFSKDEVLHYHKVINDLIADEVEEIHLEDRKLYLRHDLFYNDALVLKTLQSDRISLKNIKNTAALHFTFKDFPYFGIWAAKDAPFVCLEPWCGVADSEQHNQQLRDKEGIVSLAAGQKWQRSWRAEIV